MLALADLVEKLYRLVMVMVHHDHLGFCRTADLTRVEFLFLVTVDSRLLDFFDFGPDLFLKDGEMKPTKDWFFSRLWEAFRPVQKDLLDPLVFRKFFLDAVTSTVQPRNIRVERPVSHDARFLVVT